MTRRLLAVALATLMLASPAIAFAQDTPAATDAPKKAKHHAHHKAKKAKKTMTEAPAK